MHCGDTCDMSRSQVRHVHDPVSSIDGDRNYIAVTVVCSEFRRSETFLQCYINPYFEVSYYVFLLMMVT